jgi:hypothetical protein
MFDLPLIGLIEDFLGSADEMGLDSLFDFPIDFTFSLR